MYMYLHVVNTIRNITIPEPLLISTLLTKYPSSVCISTGMQQGAIRTYLPFIILGLYINQQAPHSSHIHDVTRSRCTRSPYVIYNSI